MPKPLKAKKKRVYVPVPSVYLEVGLSAREVTRPKKVQEIKVNLPSTLECRPVGGWKKKRKRFDPFK